MGSTDCSEAQAEVNRLEQALRHARLKLGTPHLGLEGPDIGSLLPTTSIAFSPPLG